MFTRGRARFLSQFDVPVDVTNGDIVMAANGGGGSVDLISDETQDIIVKAAGDFNVTSEDSNYVYSEVGLNIITDIGDIRFTQLGNDQMTNIHSEGSILLKAEALDGAQFYSQDYTARAKRDILFDSIGTFSIGADAPGLTGTEPEVVMMPMLVSPSTSLVVCLGLSTVLIAPASSTTVLPTPLLVTSP